MEIQTQEIEYCKLKVHYEADVEQIDAKRTDVLAAFKDAPVKGFRNKPPMNAIRIYYAKQIDASLKQALCEEAFHNALFKEQVKPFSSPQFSNIMLSRNKFTCDIEFNVRPKFELAPYTNIEIPKQNMNFNLDEAVEKALENMRVRFGDSRPFEDTEFATTGDMVIIDYKAYDGDTLLDTISGTGQIINIGQSVMPGFDDNLLGMKLEEERTFDLNVSNEALPSFAGKTLKFVVKLVMGSKMIPMPLNDELAHKVGKTNMTELREHALGIAQAKQQETERALNLQQLMNRLLEANDIKVPSWLSMSEAQYLTSSNNISLDSLSSIDQGYYLTLAEKNVKVSLILDSVRELEPEAQLSDVEVIEMIRAKIAESKNPKEVDDVLGQMNSNGQLSILAARLRDEHCCDWLLKQVKFIE